MSSIGKLQAALAAATQETTLALANLNFDFALVKVEAPPEFKALASNLSPARIAAAEGGSIHLTARRLGSLFDEILPDIANLVSAYGTRVSAISQAFKPNPSNKYGPFNSFAGVDATSIWAAATSGPSAVAVHLLACMLARLWPSDEAISIWSELVADRKNDLQASAGKDSFKLNNLVLIQTQVSNDQLAELDASARAWLRAADTVNVVAESQLRALDFLSKIDGLSVNRFVNVYKSVVQAWTTALTTMNHVVAGASFSVSADDSSSAVHVEDGAVLLALSSWHLYPDIVVLPTNETLTQKDTLIGQGGIIALGLERSDNHNITKGVNWSLSLAHLKYYGSPVLTSRTMTSSSARWTFQQFSIVVLGSLLATWNVSTAQIPEALQLLITLANAALTHELKHHLRFSVPASWLSLLAQAAKECHDATNEAKQVCRKLLNVGLRRPWLLQTEDASETLISSFLQPSITNVLQRPIDFLIDMITDRYESPHEWFIKAGPYYISADKQHVWSTNPEENGHTWTHDSSYPKSTYVWHRNISVREQQLIWKNPPECLLTKERRPAPKGTELVFDLCERFVVHRVDIYKINTQNSIDEDKKAFTNHCVGLTDIGRIFKRYGLLNRLVSQHILHYQELGGQAAQSLNAFASCSQVYSRIPDATVSPKLLDTGLSLGACRWTEVSETPSRHASRLCSHTDGMKITRCQAFACIALMETGTMDMDPSQMTKVMAIASEDSIYVPAAMLNDPATRSKPWEMRRVFGNIGRSGLAFLTSPDAPIIRKPDTENWMLVNHEEFDGKLEDCFQTTSLHLEFTGYERPGITTSHGGRYVDSFFIEARVAVHDRGKWVADLDVLRCLDHENLAQLVQQPNCEQSCAGSKPKLPMTAIDSWEELLEAPLQSAVIRAHGNWQARLAASAISLALGNNTVIFGSHGCWNCAEKYVSGDNPIIKTRFMKGGQSWDTPALGKESREEPRAIFIL